MIPPIVAYGLPSIAGIGLRAPHIREVQERLPAIGWLEVHAENYMSNGFGPRALNRLRQHYPLSLHGVGLSLGSAAGIDKQHLARLAECCRRFEPQAVSEHLSWSSGGGAYLNDLLPVPYDERTLRIVARNVEQTQEALRRPILIENLSAYVSYAQSYLSEPQFLAELAERTGCGLLLDINNVYVSSRNLAFDAENYIAALPSESIGEIHLAGHSENATPDGSVLIDSHNTLVAPAVWSLYARTVARIGRRPTLIEWDSDLPPLNVLLGEAMWADLMAGAMCLDCAPSQKRVSEMTTPPALRAAANTNRVEYAHA